MLQLTTIIFLIAFSLLAIVHAIALEFALYWHFFWFDLPMHFFGGAIVALGFFTLRDLKLFPNKNLTLKKILFLVLCIGLVWETFEFFAGIPIYDDYITDTSIDIVLGVCGGILGFFVGNAIRNLR